MKRDRKFESALNGLWEKVIREREKQIAQDTIEFLEWWKWFKSGRPTKVNQ